VHPDTFEEHLVKVKEGDSIVGPLVPTYRLPWGTGEHCYVLVMPFREGAIVLDAQLSYVIPPGLHGGQARVLIEQLVGSPKVKGPVVDFGGWRVGRPFCTRHSLMKKLKKEERKKV